MVKGKARHLFPGNNTSKGFYSYYQHIMLQQEANHIFCMKGGPGVGKSTFMKRLGRRMQDKGYDAEYLHCSSDPDSLDGVVFPDIRVALIDGTAPHVVDPKNPGAVDEIINLGACWDLDGIKTHRQDILDINAEVGRLFARAYKYIAAAKKVLDDIILLYDNATDKSKIYQEAQKIIDERLSLKPVSMQPGKQRAQFASAVTPSGIIHYLDTLIDDTYDVYRIKNYRGVGVNMLLKRIVQEAVIRGFDTEVYYDPLDPEEKVDHVIIPRLGLAFVSENEYYNLPQKGWKTIDLTQYTDSMQIEKNVDALAFDEKVFNMLMNEAVSTLKKAKTAHDAMEKYYIPHMNFDKVNMKEEEVFSYIQTFIDSHTRTR